MRSRRAALGVLVASVVLVPATVAAAGQHATAKPPLALVLLQKAQLGPAGKAFKLDYGSGPNFIADVGLKAFDTRYVIGDGAFRARGRVALYSLDYGDPFAGRTGVMEIRTGVEMYKTPAAAKVGFALWRHVDSFLQIINPGIYRKIDVPPVGPRRFAYLHTWHTKGLHPIVGLDEQMLAGNFVLDLTVIAGSAKVAQHAAPRLARLLYQRLHAMLTGDLAGKPAKLPPKPKSGQARGGPDLSAMILAPADVGQSNPAHLTKRYRALPPTLSTYDMSMKPAGLYDRGLEQQIFWWPTAREATYAEAYLRALFAKEYPTSAVDLSSVGDNATGLLDDCCDSGSELAVTLTSGRAGTFIHGSTSGGAHSYPTKTDIKSLAQAAANRLDAGLGP